MESLDLSAAPRNPSPAFWKDKRVLVTGHTGFKGGWLLVLLNMLGARAAGLALAPQGVPNLFDCVNGGALCDSRIADIRDAGAVRRIVEAGDPEIILHMAAQPLVRASYADPIAAYMTNVMGTAHVLDACRHAPSLKAIVSVTTDKCYANDGRRAGYPEDAPLGGRDPYSSSKACAELASASWRESFLAPRGIGLATARAGNVVGGGDWSEDRLVPDALRAFSENRILEIRNPDAVRPWQHVLEPLSGYLLLAESLTKKPQAYARGWNFGPPPEDLASVRAVVEKIGRLWGIDAPWAPQPGAHPHEEAVLTLDSSAAAAHLGWRPRLTLDAALAWTVDWARAPEPLNVMREQIAAYFEKPSL